MVVVIGSTALSYHVEGIVPKDLDLVCTYDDAVKLKKQFHATAFYPINSGSCIFMRTKEGNICEIEIAWEDSRAEKFLRFMEDRNNRHMLSFDKGQYGTEWYIPTLDVLYMLKHSHKYLKDSVHFKKTMDDIIFMRDKLGCKIRPEHEEFLKQREKDTYVNKLPKLNVSKGEFFDEETKRVQ